jgi:hypothetical protein
MVQMLKCFTPPDAEQLRATRRLATAQMEDERLQLAKLGDLG